MGNEDVRRIEFNPKNNPIPRDIENIEKQIDQEIRQGSIHDLDSTSPAKDSADSNSIMPESQNEPQLKIQSNAQEVVSKKELKKRKEELAQIKVKLRNFINKKNQQIMEKNAPGLWDMLFNSEDLDVINASLLERQELISQHKVFKQAMDELQSNLEFVDTKKYAKVFKDLTGMDLQEYRELDDKDKPSEIDPANFALLNSANNLDKTAKKTALNELANQAKTNLKSMPDNGAVKQLLNDTLVDWLGGTTTKDLDDKSNEMLIKFNKLLQAKGSPEEFVKQYKDLTGVTFDPAKIKEAISAREDFMKIQGLNEQLKLLSDKKFQNFLTNYEKNPGIEERVSGTKFSRDNSKIMREASISTTAKLMGISNKEAQKLLADAFKNSVGKAILEVSEEDQNEFYYQHLKDITSKEKINDIKQALKQLNGTDFKQAEFNYKLATEKAFGRNELSELIQKNTTWTEYTYQGVKLAAIIGASVLTGGAAGALGATGMAASGAIAAGAGATSLTLDTTEYSTDSEGLTKEEALSAAKDAGTTAVYTFMGATANQIGGNVLKASQRLQKIAQSTHALPQGASKTTQIAANMIGKAPDVAPRVLSEGTELVVDASSSYLFTRALGNEDSIISEAVQSAVPQFGTIFLKHLSGGLGKRVNNVFNAKYTENSPEIQPDVKPEIKPQEPTAVGKADEPKPQESTTKITQDNAPEATKVEPQKGLTPQSNAESLDVKPVAGDVNAKPQKISSKVDVETINGKFLPESLALSGNKHNLSQQQIRDGLLHLKAKVDSSPELKPVSDNMFQFADGSTIEFIKVAKNSKTMDNPKSFIKYNYDGNTYSLAVKDDTDIRELYQLVSGKKELPAQMVYQEGRAYCETIHDIDVIKQYYKNSGCKLEESNLQDYLKNGMKEYFEIDSEGNKIIILNAQGYLDKEKIAFIGPTRNFYDADGQLIKKYTDLQKYKELFYNKIRNTTTRHMDRFEAINTNNSRELSELKMKYPDADDEFIIDKFLEETKSGKLKNGQVTDLHRASLRSELINMKKLDAEMNAQIPDLLPHKYYRGIKGDNFGVNLLNSAKIGDEVIPDFGVPFAATKLIYEVLGCAQDGILLEIHAPIGTKKSADPSLWNQVLLPRGKSYKIIDIKDTIPGNTKVEDGELMGSPQYEYERENTKLVVLEMLPDSKTPEIYRKQAEKISGLDFAKPENTAVTEIKIKGDFDTKAHENIQLSEVDIPTSYKDRLANLQELAEKLKKEMPDLNNNLDLGKVMTPDVEISQETYTRMKYILANLATKKDGDNNLYREILLSSPEEFQKIQYLQSKLKDNIDTGTLLSVSKLDSQKYSLCLSLLNKYNNNNVADLASISQSGNPVNIKLLSEFLDESDLSIEEVRSILNIRNIKTNVELYDKLKVDGYNIENRIEILKAITNNNKDLIPKLLENKYLSQNISQVVKIADVKSEFLAIDKAKIVDLFEQLYPNNNEDLVRFLSDDVLSSQLSQSMLQNPKLTPDKIIKLLNDVNPSELNHASGIYKRLKDTNIDVENLGKVLKTANSAQASFLDKIWKYKFDDVSDWDMLTKTISRINGKNLKRAKELTDLYYPAALHNGTILGLLPSE